jgi:beta-phosphoglucomutase
VPNPPRPLAGMAFIFDMDGVLINSNPVHRQAWAAFNLRYGIETTEEMHERMYGRRNDAILRDFFGENLAEDEIQSRGAAKEALYREMIPLREEEVLVPGIRRFLEEYRELPKALATNAEPENIELVLDRFALRDHFPAIVGGHQVTCPKPHPEIYLRASDLLGVAPANCIVFEDSYSGVEAGLAAGMTVIGLRTTHDNLPGTAIAVDNFESGDLRRWLRLQSRVC